MPYNWEIGLAYFRQSFRELEALTDDYYHALFSRVLLFIPGSLPKCTSESCSIEAQYEAINLIIAHFIVLYGRALSPEEPDSVPKLQRTAKSLSEGDLAISYYESLPGSSALGTVFDWLARTAYGDLAKIILERCLAGFNGTFTV